jgi:beta-carotene hydroxylase
MTAAAVSADREARRIIKPYLGMVAWPSVLLAFGIIGSFALVCTLGVMRVIPLWMGLILNSLLLYAIQTPLHEACHGNIAGRDGRWMWFNHLIGMICGAILLHEYKAFRHMHLMHHRETNDDDLDPDHWVKVSNPFMVFFRCFTIVPFYHYFFFKKIALNPKDPTNFKVTAHVLAVYWVLYSLSFWLCLTGFTREVMALWIGPHWIGSAIIIYFFAYLPHKPHDTKNRWKATKIVNISGPMAKIINWVYLFQNYHLIHHLYPRIPFYLYPEAFRDLRPVLDRQGARIQEYGH